MGQAGTSRRCGNCGTLNAANDQFCSNCGYALSGGPVDHTLLSQPSVAAANTVIARRVTGALAQGNLLGGRYRIVQLIGKGGFGAVYRASDERFQSRRVVAVKEMSDAQLSPKDKAKALQDFRNEADLLVGLKHINLPDVSDFFEEGNKAYLVMEFINGKTLDDILTEKGGPLDEPVVMGWTLQLCNVLNYLHTRQQPIIFRDMKPANVMLSDDGLIKLIDFGIARVFKPTGTKDTSLLGSQGFAPLEQYGRGQSDVRSDIYALGATLYNLLTNEVPMDAPARRVYPQTFMPPRQLNPRISPTTEGIILKAMGENPQDRYQSAVEMYQAIAATGIATVSNSLFPVGGTLTQMSAIQPTATGASQTQIPTVQSQLQQGGSHPVSTQAASQGNAAATSKAGQQPGTNNPYTLSGGNVNNPYTVAGGTANAYNPTNNPYGPAGNPYGPQTQPPPPPAANPPTQSPQPNRSRRNILIGSLVAAAALGTGIYFITSHNQSGPPKPTSQTGGGTLTLNFTYSTEKQAWMQPAINSFNGTHTKVNGKTIQVIGDSRGSVETQQGLLNKSLSPMPSAWSPASDLELRQLSNDWQKQHGASSSVFASQYTATSLVLSPLVFAVWKDRAEVLQKHYGSIDWPAIHDALTQPGWSSIGGPSAWQAVKLGQTRPDTSNSGLLTVTLIAYAYYKKQRDLSIADIDDSGFLKYFNDIEGAVQEFGKSSGSYLSGQVILIGPSSYDIVTTYENLVVTNQQQAQSHNGEPLQPYYPSLNIVSNHPFAILQGDWVTSDEQQAAKAFRDFLLADAQQKQALLNGFRPVNINDPLGDSTPGNPFQSQAVKPFLSSIPRQLPPQVQTPDGSVIDEIMTQWLQKYQYAPTASV